MIGDNDRPGWLTDVDRRVMLIELTRVLHELPCGHLKGILRQFVERLEQENWQRSVPTKTSTAENAFVESTKTYATSLEVISLYEAAKRIGLSDRPGGNQIGFLQRLCTQGFISVLPDQQGIPCVRACDLPGMAILVENYRAKPPAWPTQDRRSKRDAPLI